MMFCSVYISAGSNNTIMTLVNFVGKVLCVYSSGRCGFKNSRKSTSYSAQMVSNSIKNKIKYYGYKVVNIYIKGFGVGRESSIRSLYSKFYYIKCIYDVTPIVFNGCRPKKIRRV